MAKLFNLARMTTATTGTGTITLGTAVSGYLTFAQAGAANADVVSYAIKDGNNSEIGTGTYTSSGTTLTRNVVNSTNSNAAISLSGTAEVFISPRAADLVIPRGYIDGLKLSTAGSSSTFSISAGMAVDSANLEMLLFASAYTKTTSAWAVGTAAGALDTGSIANSTWYHVHLIKRADTGVVDVLLSLSATAPTMPTNYTLSRRIGSMKTNASAQWTAFVQNGNLFEWSVPVGDLSAIPSTVSVSRTLTVPTGVIVAARFSAWYFCAGTATASGQVLFSNLATTDTAAGGSLFSLAALIQSSNFQASGSFEILTNTSAQIRSNASFSNSDTSLRIATTGWVDTRGRD